MRIFYADKPCIAVFSSFTVNYDGVVQLCDSDIEQQEVVGAEDVAAYIDLYRKFQDDY